MQLHVVSWIIPHTFNIAYWAKRKTKVLYEVNKCFLHPPSIWRWLLHFCFHYSVINAKQWKKKKEKILIRGTYSKWFGKRSSNQLSVILIWQLHCKSQAPFQIILILTLPWLQAQYCIWSCAKHQRWTMISSMYKVLFPANHRLPISPTHPRAP